MLPKDPNAEQFAARIARLRPDVSSLDANTTFYRAGYAAGQAAISQRLMFKRLQSCLAIAALLFLSSFAAYNWGNSHGYSKANLATKLASDSSSLETSKDALREGDLYSAERKIAIGSSETKQSTLVSFRRLDEMFAPQDMLHQARLHASTLSQLARHDAMDKPLSGVQQRDMPTQIEASRQTVTPARLTTRVRFNDLQRIVETY